MDVWVGAATFFCLRVGIFSFAVRTTQVIAVTAIWGEPDAFTWYDLHAHMSGVPQPQPAFGLILEAPLGHFGVGVDRVQQVQVDKVGALPAFGLMHPELFTGVLRLPETLPLVFDVARLARFIQSRAHSEFA